MSAGLGELADALARLLLERGPALVVTGAGISTASGLPDFRSPNGVWSRLDPLRDGHVSMLARDPGRVWACWAEPLLAADLRPNPAHVAVAELDALGLVAAVVTQNIDGLHEAAGSHAIELHGNLRTAPCTRCGAVEPMATAFARYVVTGHAPLCDCCSGPLRPPVVLFGEHLPYDALAAAERHAHAVRSCLCIGTSLQVWPAAGLPYAVLARGGALALVSIEPTELWDVATLTIAAPAEELLPLVVERVRALQPA